MLDQTANPNSFPPSVLCIPTFPFTNRSLTRDFGHPELKTTELSTNRPLMTRGSLTDNSL